MNTNIDKSQLLEIIQNNELLTTETKEELTHLITKMKMLPREENIKLNNEDFFTKPYEPVESRNKLFSIENENIGLKNEIIYLKNEIVGLKNENIEFKNEIFDLKNENLKIMNEIVYLENENVGFKKTNKDYNFRLTVLEEKMSVKI